MDDAELLSILEGDGDGDGDPLWLPDKLLRKAEGSTTPSNPAPGSLHAAPPQLSPQELSPPAPRLDPALEKELALKQLMELPIKFPSKKPEKKEKVKKLFTVLYSALFFLSQINYFTSFPVCRRSQRGLPAEEVAK